MEKIYAFVCEPVKDDDDGDWAIYYGSDRQKIIDLVNSRKERLNVSSIEVEVEIEDGFYQGLATIVFDENDKPVKAILAEKDDYKDNEYPCQAIKIY